jgi:hypothetical protein
VSGYIIILSKNEKLKNIKNNEKVTKILGVFGQNRHGIIAMEYGEKTVKVIQKNEQLAHFESVQETNLEIGHKYEWENVFSRLKLNNITIR